MFPQPVEGAAGPYDAGYLPRVEMFMHPVDEAITEPVAKLGGDPVWLEEPCWPLNPRTGEPLDFIGQIPVPVEPGDELRMAYLFLSYEDYETGGMDPEDGESVLLIQPGGRIPGFATVGPTGTSGRSLFAFDAEDQQVPMEFRIEMRPVSEEQERSLEKDGSFDVDNYIGGRADYRMWAGVEAPWRFFFALVCTGDTGPYFLNFGHGTGYAYLSPDGLEGRFGWDAA
ncbi:hypothetical protein ABZV60_05825 [Streptomyces sp. NPDC004787]|uniref:hypothetical protein n=1 Tax=Streptomyces sp. NPDC004787 TaxID=3154291 RepID=UPI0033A3DCA3